MNIYLISEYVNRLRKSDIIYYAEKQGISLDKEEVELIYDYIKKDYKTKSNTYSYNIYKRSDVLNFLNWIYKDSNIYLDRKYASYLDFIKNGSKYHKTK